MNEVDLNSQTWRAIAAWAEQGIRSGRKALEAKGLPAADTEYERGRIAAMRELVRLADPPIKVDPPTDYSE